MKILAILLLSVPYLVSAQNLFDLRTQKSEMGHKPNIEAEVIDGRLSDKPSFMTPMEFVSPIVQEAQKISYKLRHSADLGLPIYLEVYNAQVQRGFAVRNPSEATNSLVKVLNDLPGLFGWQSSTSLTKNSTIDEGEQKHYKYTQYINGVKVKGGEWNMHTVNGVVTKASGRIYPSTPLDPKPKVLQNEAITKAENHIYSKVKSYKAPGEYGVQLHRSSEVSLYIDFEVGEGLNPQLVYVIEVRPTDLNHYLVWIDAQSGAVLKVRDELCSTEKTATAKDLNNVNRTVNSYQVGSTYYMVDATKSMWPGINSQPGAFPDNPVGAVWTIDASNTAAQSFSHVSSSNNTWSDKSAVSAHANAGLAFDYFKGTHNRNSINGSGGTITSVVNVSDDDGSSLANAYWNGQAMFYGNGGSTFTPLAGALDVAGHELTHGVVSNSANLEYQDQSGAINESMADVFGAMIDRDDWKMGEDIVRPGIFAGGALRNLQNPHNGGSSLSDRGYQPEKMSEYYTGTQDNGGVHINSGIVNRAYYLAATAITKNKAEKIWYRALTVYLTKRSEFLDLRYACVDAANDLYGTTEANAIKAAFDTVQIYDPNAGSGGSGGGAGGGGDIPQNTGTENIVYYDINPSNSNTLYKTTTAPSHASHFQDLSTTIPNKKPSVRDDGSFLFYVSSSNTINRIQLTSPYTETVLSNPDWDNVAISKDGKRLAAISSDRDGKIWVYDFVTQSWKSFILYNPTYTEGVDAGNVNYADAIEFDNTGQFVLYDAQNEITNSSGSNLSWWDVGVLRVWDNETDGFGDGKVEKIFSQLPEGVSIGNATYAKNSSYIVAYDYITDDDVSIVATNLNTNTSATIYSQDQLGFPNYSNKDDKIIFDAETTIGTEVIAVADLENDKINRKSGTNASVVITSGSWGVWYANGTRSLLSDKKDILSFAVPTDDGAVEGTISGTTINLILSSGTSVSNLPPTFTNSADAKVSVNNIEQTSGVSSQNFTNDVVYKVTAQDGSSKNYTVKIRVEMSSVDELSKQINIYPNPSSSKIFVQSNLKINDISMYDKLGNEVLKGNGSELNLENISSGIYFVAIETSKGKIVKRVVKL